jgi:hypothetical protein
VKISAVLLATMLSLTTACADRAVRILFIGNSLTYVGNLPAVFEALCKTSGHKCSAEMIAQGGATLKQRADDQSLSSALKLRAFDYVVLQERGGDYIALPSRTEDRANAERAAETLAVDARKLGLKTILLGTYQPDPRASVEIVKAESAIATRLDIQRVSVSDTLACGRPRHGSLRWFGSDGMHPGADLTLLMAVSLYREIFGTSPAAAPLLVNAPIFEPSTGPRADSFASSQPVKANIPRSVTYDAATMSAIIELSERSCI